ncbi:MAG: hypothetical protein PHG95_03755 [Patescibacteria group bacterium]|nr:hypothetical protein [Patescibacteria group bacterium]
MKAKTFVVIFAIFMAFCLSVSAQTQSRRGGEFYIGQLRQTDVEKKIKLLNKEIDKKNNTLEKLNKELLLLSHRPPSIEGSNRVNEIAEQKEQLLLSIKKLEANKDSLLIRSTMDDEQLYFSGNSRNLDEAATAYAIVRTTNASSQQSTQPERFTGLLVNYWNQLVTAKIKGPGNFYREIILPPGSKKLPVQKEFKFSIPGNYTVTFESQYGSKSVTKEGGMPNVIYYDDAGITAYDFRAAQYGR